jgi:hypothetical protein
MGTTTAALNGATVCTVADARRLLMDTGRLSEIQVNDLQAIIDRFKALRP